MSTFLSRLALAYYQAERNSLAGYSFVFPNKRSATFFAHDMSLLTRREVAMPEVMTIADLVHLLSGTTATPRTELLFILYNSYRKVLSRIGPKAELPEDFDRFRFWGEVLLSDFNDVDMNMAEPRQLFKNVKDFKEIKSTYLTEEQREVIRHYWGEDPYWGQMPDESPDFWTHIEPDRDKPMSRRFIMLWEILGELYAEFNAELNARFKCYPGMAYRRAAERLRKHSDLPSNRYIFVGFNALSISELAIFNRMKALGAADFYWDFPEGMLRIPGNKAARFIERNVSEFPSLYNVSGPSPHTQITIMGIPSNTGQAVEASALLGRMAASGDIPNPANAIDTAVVLPDEELLVPLLSSLPPELDNVNITMGYPLRLTAFAALLRKIVGMQLRARKIRGDVEFFRDDVNAVLAQPLLRSFADNSARGILDHMRSRRLFNLPSKVVADEFPELRPLFTPVSDLGSAAETLAYTRTLLQFLGASLTDAMDLKLLKAATEIVDTMQTLVADYGITMAHNTFFHLLERSLNAATVNFEGEPLAGLQIMGVLETRALDFRNVIMLSMNERIFPRRRYQRSFIPDTLRRGYGLSTIEFQESIFAYYFYRLISRAENAYLLFDARNSALKSGEMSRYLYQLRYLSAGLCDVTFTMGRYPITLTEAPQLESARDKGVRKTPEVMARLNRFRDASHIEGFKLSASAINQYINCPLSFFLERVAEIRIPDEQKDYIDEGTYGTIVHEVAERAYKAMRDSGHARVSRTILDELIADKSGQIGRLITEAVNRHYLGLADEALRTELSGESRILGHVIHHVIRLMFEAEKRLTPDGFTFIDGEFGGHKPFPLTIGDITVNFTMSIDRIDRLPDGTLRIIDYKTGADDTRLKSIAAAFDSSDPTRPKAMVQLMLYCHAYAQLTGDTAVMQPLIVRTRSIASEGITGITVGEGRDKQPFFYDASAAAEFRERMAAVLDEMFDTSVPFYRAEGDNHCKYCKFTRICHSV